MFVFIRRHQVFGFLFIGLVILSFIIWFSPNQSSGFGGRSEGDFGSIDGKPVNREEYAASQREAQLAYFFRFQEWPEGEASRQRFDPNRETLNRTLLVRRIRKMGIQASDKAVADRITEIFRDRRTGAFDLRYYDGFVENTLHPRGIARQDFERFLKHELAIQHLAAVSGLSGQLVTPREAEAAFRAENEQLSVQIALFSVSNYLSKVSFDSASVGQFFTNREAFYRVPERIRVSYLKFDVTNYFPEADEQIAKITNFNQQVDQLYLQQGAEAFKDPEGKVLPPDAAKAKIREDYRKTLALRGARKKANDFLTELFGQPARTDSLDNLAAARGFEVHVTDPFTEFGLPPGLRVPPAFSRAAFKLSTEQPFSEAPVLGEDGVYVVGLKERIPSSVPPFEGVQERVTEDYKMNQARELARQAGSAFAAAITNEMPRGKSFEMICVEAGIVPLRPPPISTRSTAIPGLDRSVSPADVGRVASSLTPGTASSFQPTRDGGFVVFLESRVPVDLAKLNAELPEYLIDMRDQRQFQVFNEWFRKQFEVAQIKSPASAADENKERGTAPRVP